jgi:transcriptional regulator with XRE-family HTH domain
VSSEANERWHKGEALRKARIKRGLTLFEQAAILGVEPIVLNDIEHGRRPADELNNRPM